MVPAAAFAVPARFSHQPKLACVIPGHLSANAITAASVRFLQQPKPACVIPGHLSANATNAASVRLLQKPKSVYVIPGHFSANASTAASVRFLHPRKMACVIPWHLSASDCIHPDDGLGNDNLLDLTDWLFNNGGAPPPRRCRIRRQSDLGAYRACFRFQQPLYHLQRHRRHLQHRQAPANCPLATTLVPHAATGEEATTIASSTSAAEPRADMLLLLSADRAYCSRRRSVAPGKKHLLRQLYQFYTSGVLFFFRFNIIPLILYPIYMWTIIAVIGGIGVLVVTAVVVIDRWEVANACIGKRSENHTKGGV